MTKRYDLEPLKVKMRARGARTALFLGRHTEGCKTLVQMGFGIVTLVGISMYSIPIALILAGVAGIVSIERQ